MKKQPKQERSRQIVDALLSGATRILSRQPLAKVTTNKIAELAGVGIGSLYDYFPDKRAIVSSLIDRRVDGVVTRFREILASAPEQSLEEKIEAVARFLESEFLERKDFLREIFFLAPEQGKMEGIYRARIETAALLSTHLQERGFTPRLADQKSFLLLHGILGITESFIMIDPPAYSPAELGTELRRLMRFVLVE